LVGSHRLLLWVNYLKFNAVLSVEYRISNHAKDVTCRQEFRISKLSLSLVQFNK